MNNCPSNISEILLLLERYHQNCQAVLAATGMNGLKFVWYIREIHPLSQGILIRISQE